MKILWVPHMAWPLLDGQRERHLISKLALSDEIHVLTWQAMNGRAALLRSLRARTWVEDGVVVHQAIRLPNPVGRLTGYERGFWLNEVLFQSHVRRLVRENGIDLVIYGLSHKLIGLPPRDLRVPLVFDYLDLCLYASVEERLVAMSELVVCSSNVLTERVASRAKRVAYIPNGVDATRFDPGRREETRRRLGLADRTVISLIGLTSSLSLFWVDAVAEVARTVPNVTLLAVGGGPLGGRSHLQPMRERAAQLGIHLVTTGQIPHAAVPDYFVASDVGLYPGDADPYYDAACPIKVLEYTAAGRPVVATDLAELRRLAFPNVFLAAPRADAFAKAISRALASPPALPDLGRFDWSRLATELRAHCAALIAERGTSNALELLAPRARRSTAR